MLLKIGGSISLIYLYINKTILYSYNSDNLNSFNLLNIGPVCSLNFAETIILIIRF